MFSNLKAFEKSQLNKSVLRVPARFAINAALLALSACSPSPYSHYPNPALLQLSDTSSSAPVNGSTNGTQTGSTPVSTSPAPGVRPEVGSTVPTLPVSPAPVSTKPNWQKMLVCDQGRVWVDVDLNERRNIQVVSRDLAANQYFATNSVISKAEALDLTQVIFSLHQDTGIFKLADFGVANDQEQFLFQSPEKIGNDYMTQFSVVSRAFRDNNGTGLTLEFVRATMQVCSFYDAETKTCNGNLTYPVRDRYIGNWFFPGCQPYNF